MSYTPFYTCPHCEKRIEAKVSGDLGYQPLCGCDESRKAWEKAHREEIERRKQARRRGTK